MDKLILCAVSREGLRIENAMEWMSPARRERLAVIRRTETAELSVCTELALCMAFRESGLVPREYRYGKNGKPCFPEGPYLSLCHAGDRGFALLSPIPVGFDAEREERDLSRVEGHIRAFREEGSSAELWTGKEAYLKLTGEGISVPMADITIREGNVFREGRQVARLLRPEIPGYVTALAAERELPVRVSIFSAKEALILLKRGEKYDTMTQNTVRELWNEK